MKDIINIKQSIIAAATSNLKIELTSSEEYYNDVVNKNLENLLFKRKEVANLYLSTKDVEEKKDIQNVFLFINEDIKKIIGV